MEVGFFVWPKTPQYTVRMARLGDELGFDLFVRRTAVPTAHVNRDLGIVPSLRCRALTSLSLCRRNPLALLAPSFR